MLKPNIRRPKFLASLAAWRAITSTPGWMVVGTKPKKHSTMLYSVAFAEPDSPGRPSATCIKALRKRFNQVDIADAIPSAAWEVVEKLLLHLYSIAPKTTDLVLIHPQLANIWLGIQNVAISVWPDEISWSTVGPYVMESNDLASLEKFLVGKELENA